MIFINEERKRESMQQSLNCPTPCGFLRLYLDKFADKRKIDLV